METVLITSKGNSYGGRKRKNAIFVQDDALYFRDDYGTFTQNYPITNQGSPLSCDHDYYQNEIGEYIMTQFRESARKDARIRYLERRHELTCETTLPLDLIELILLYDT